MKKSNEKVVRKSRARDSFFAKYYPYPVDHDRYEYRIVSRRNSARRIEVRPKQSIYDYIGCDIGPSLVVVDDTGKTCICYCKDMGEYDQADYDHSCGIDVNTVHNYGGKRTPFVLRYRGMIHNGSGPAIINSSVDGHDFKHDSFFINGVSYSEIDGYINACEATDEEKLILKIQYDGLLLGRPIE